MQLSRGIPGWPLIFWNILHDKAATRQISLVSLFLQFGISGITGKFEFISDWENPSPLFRQAMASMLGADDSLDQDGLDDVKDDLKMQLALLHTALKDLNPNFDFAPIVNPLLGDQGPAMANGHRSET